MKAIIRALERIGLELVRYEKGGIHEEMAMMTYSDSEGALFSVAFCDRKGERTYYLTNKLEMDEEKWLNLTYVDEIEAFINRLKDLKIALRDHYCEIMEVLEQAGYKEAR